ncbi:MAG: hypothetical protein QW756_04020 [Nitrososphaerota archaeon]
MVSKALKFILEATVLAILLTMLPIAVLTWLYLSQLMRPIYLVAWMGLAVGWTGLLTFIYLRRGRRTGSRHA